MIKTLYSILLTQFIVVFIHAQTPVNLTANNINNLFLIELEKRTVKDPNEFKQDIDGTPFLIDEFQSGEVITNRGMYNPQRMRYNIYIDAIQFDLGNQFLYLDPQSIIKEVSLGKSVFKVKTYPYQSSENRGFLIELVPGNFSLYAKKNITIERLNLQKLWNRWVNLRSTFGCLIRIFWKCQTVKC